MPKVKKPYSLVNGKLVFATRAGRKRTAGRKITDEDLKDLNLQKLMVRRSTEISKGVLARRFN